MRSDFVANRPTILFRKGFIVISIKIFTIVFSMAVLGIAQVAFAGAGVVCNEAMNDSIDLHGTDTSECNARSDGTAKAHSKAVGAGSFADAELETDGKTNAVATGGSSAGAFSDTQGKSNAKASDQSTASSQTDHSGSAKSNASHASGAAAEAHGKCKATATAINGSMALAACNASGQFVIAKATNGGFAQGFGFSAPTCTANGGTATVKSSGGNCP
jgi:hypothetical protein